MENVKFEGCNTVYGADQPEYKPLHAQRTGNVTITCYRLSFKERVKMLFTGLLWLGQMNFGQPLQPQLPSLNKDDHETGKKLIELCVHWGIPVAEMAPLPLKIGGMYMWSGPDGKITHEELVAVTGLKKSRSNQEERDAALLAWRLAGLPLRINKRK